jgi:hypothetical protein
MLMNLLFGIAFLLAFATAAVPTASQPGQEQSPKAVVEEYWKLVAQGALLTPEGWNEAAKFFVFPSPLPRERVILVVHGDFAVWNPVVKGNSAEVMVGYRSVGKIDPSLRFWPPNDKEAVKAGILHRLVLADRHWEIGPDGEPAKEVTGPRQWRMEKPPVVIWVTIDPAIRYLTKMRDRASDPIAKKNADKTILILKSIAAHDR